MLCARYWIVVTVGLAVAACGATTNETSGQGCVKVVNEDGEPTDKCLPIAPKERRVDVGSPTFTNPTSVTNRLHPTSEIAQTIYGGQVDGAPFRTEVTLLPDVKTISWQGRDIKAVTSQYLAFSGGRIKEVALDWYAQADDGSVWYLGEDVFNYEDGKVADTEGTWIAGEKAPAAMIMPAKPAVGNVYRPENAPGLVFEEVTVKAVDQKVTGPGGTITGALVVEELHMDGSREAKTFAPGYGEFSTGTPEGELEQASLALPADAGAGTAPTELLTLSAAVRAAVDTASRADWAAAASAVQALDAAWQRYRPADAPLDLLRKQMSRDIATLASAVAAKDSEEARHAALRVAQNDLDLQSRYRPVAATDQARVLLWARQLLADAAAGDAASVAGDGACLKWTFDRLRHTGGNARTVGAAIDAVRTATERGDLSGASSKTRELLLVLSAR